MLELWQTEWCPASQRVRQRLTERGVDYVVRQVPVERDERTRLVEATGEESIPVLVLADGSLVTGEDEILATLDDLTLETAGSVAHREKARLAHTKMLGRECA